MRVELELYDVMVCGEGKRLDWSDVEEPEAGGG